MPSRMRGFYWVTDGRLAGLPRPGGARPLAEDLDSLRAEGIRLLISLTGRPVDAAEARSRGIEVLHIPVLDFGAPTPEQQRALVEAVDAALAAGRAVGVHCAAGLGRTGTMLATCLVSAGRDPRSAIDEIRRLRPGSIQSAEQERAVHAYHTWLAGDRDG